MESRSLIDFWFLVSRACLDMELNITQTSIVKQACGNKEYVTGKSVYVYINGQLTTNDLIADFSVYVFIIQYLPIHLLRLV